MHEWHYVMVFGLRFGEDKACVEGAVMEGQPRTKEWWLKVVAASFCKVQWKCVERVHERWRQGEDTWLARCKVAGYMEV